MAIPGIYVKQKMDWFEEFSGCELPNEYYVYQIDQKNPKKKKGSKIFKYKEKSACCERQFCKGDCKPFTMEVKSELSVNPEKQVMICTKECKCTYYCFNRSEMICKYNEFAAADGKEHYLGKVYDPWDCMHYTFELRTGTDEQNSGETEYIINGSCCQLYFHCKCPCEKCQKVVFEIHEGKTISPGNKVGDITRQGRDICKNVVYGDDADEFVVTFPENANWRQRAMFMNCVVFMDYSMFEDTSKNKNQNQN